MLALLMQISGLSPEREPSLKVEQWWLPQPDSQGTKSLFPVQSPVR